VAGPGGFEPPTAGLGVLESHKPGIGTRLEQEWNTIRQSNRNRNGTGMEPSGIHSMELKGSSMLTAVFRNVDSVV